MKYVRVFDGCDENEYITIHEEHCESVANMQNGGFDFEGCIIKQADNIEELCDGYVIDHPINAFKFFYIKEDMQKYLFNTCFRMFCLNELKIYALIRTEKGLIYAAKMNEKGEFELL